MTPPLDTAAIQARADAATPGPWEAVDTDQHWSLHMQDFPMQILKAPKQGTPYAEYWPNTADAAFIVAARTDVPALLAEVKLLATITGQQHAEIDRIRGERIEARALVAELQQQLAAYQAAITAVRALDKHAGEASDDRDTRYEQLDPEDYQAARAIDDTLWDVMHAIDTALSTPR